MNAAASDAPDGPGRPVTRLIAALVALLAFGAIAFVERVFGDGDTGWHLATGRWIIANGRVPDADPFSLTFAGKPWVAHEWGAELVMAGALQLGGWALLALLTSGCVAATLYMIGRHAARWLDGRKLLVVMALVLVGLMPSILSRPHVLAWPLLAGWMLLLLDARRADRAPPLWAAALMLVWTNLHGSFVFGLLLIGLFALEALVLGPDRKRVVIGWGGFGLLALAAALVSPHGLDGLLFPFMVSGMESLPMILEWRATELPRDWGFGVMLLAGLAGLLGNGARLPLFRLLLLAVLLYLAFAHVRHQALLAIVGGMLIVEPLGRALDAKVTGDARGVPMARWLPLLVIIGIIGLRLAVPLQRPDSGENPGAAIAAVPAALRAQPVFNEYGFGGSLIFAGIRPFIDGRADMYGDAFMRTQARAASGNAAAFDAVVARWGVAWTIMPPQSPLVRRLDGDPRWRRIHADRWAVVHVQAPAP